MKPGSKYILSVAIAGLVCVLVYYTFGFYFEAYEHLYNYLTLSAIESNKVFGPVTDNDFLLLQLYGYIQILIPGLEISSAGKVFFMILGVASIVFIIINLFDDKYSKAAVLLGVFALLLESFIFVNTVRIGFLLGFSAITLFLLNYKQLKPRHFLFFYAMGVFSIMQRNEIALLVFSIGSLIGFLFSKRKLLAHSLIIAVFAIVAYQFMTYYNFNHHHYAYTFLDNEREVIHQNNLKLGEGELQSALTGNCQNVKTLKTIATAFFLLDEPIIDYQNIKDLVYHQGILDYIFNNPDFIDSYLGNLNDFLAMLFDNYLLLLCLFILFSVYGIYVSYKNDKLIRAILLFLSISVIPLVLNIFIPVPERITAPYLSLNIIAIVVYIKSIAPTLLNKKLSLAMGLLLLIFGVSQFYYGSFERYERKKYEEYFANSVYEDFYENEKMSVSKRPVILSIISWKAIPVKLFSDIYPNNRIPAFISLSFYDYSDPLRMQSELVFGKDYSELTSRFDHVIEENNGLIYGHIMGMNFVKSYLKYVHDYHLEFEVVDDFGAEQDENDLVVNKYRISKVN